MDVKQVSGNAYGSPVPDVPQSASGTAKVSESGAQEVSKADAERAPAALAERSEEDRKATRQDVESVLRKLNIVMNAMSIQAKFEVHQPTKEIMVRVVNVDSGQVIREIPPKKILDMVARMQELVGLLLDERG